MAAQTIVQFGPFRGCTLTELRNAKRAYVAASASGGFNGRLSGASINGQSFSYSGDHYTREELGEQLSAAFQSLGSDEFGSPVGHSGAATF